MSDFFDSVVEILKCDERFFTAEGELLRNAVYEASMQMDTKLIKMLYENEITRERFFVEVDGIAVFDKIGFGWVINNREFLPDSYTRYKNKIGLVNGKGEFISSINDVELVFPYKDCVLAGGQTKEEQKRSEIFYNETLAPDEVDRLLFPKVLSEAKLVTKDGENSINFLDSEDNLFVKGNNLLVLSSLRKKYSGKVRMAYWDIPYNTGSDSFGYNDKFSRSSWLTFIKNRVEQLIPLLDDISGVLLVQCSFHQYAYLKVLLDEVMKNYVMTFNVLVRHPDRTLTADKEFNDVIEYILVYSKASNYKMPKLSEEKTIDDYVWQVEELVKGEETFFDGRRARIFRPGEYILKKVTPAKENFKIMTVRGSIKEKVSSGRFYVKYLQPIEAKYPPKTIFKVENIGDDMYSYRYFYLPPQGNKNGAYLQGMPTSSTHTYKPYANFLDFVQSYNVVNDEGIVEFRNGKKPEDLISYIMKIFTSERDLVLDAFAGSGTTASVAIKLNRQFITIEQMEYAESLTKKRLMGVISGKENDILPEEDYSGGGSFVYCKLLEMNQRYIDDIQKATDDQDLTSIWKEMKESGFICFNVKPKDIDETVLEFNLLSFEDKKKLLIELLDKNQLYVNYCDMDDETYVVTEEDKSFTKSFYEEV